MGLITTPRIRRTAQNTQLTYNVSRRINTIETYPIQSPQGATILLFGHENGVTILWRGGRRFKPARAKSPPPEKEKTNGSSDDAVMIIDSDDDEPPSKSQVAPKFEDKPEFEDEVEDAPYPEIIQTLDLSLGTSVLHVAVMPLALGSSSEISNGEASILGQKMIFAVSCATNDVYLVTLPLTPPSPESKARPDLRNTIFSGKAGTGAWGESLILLGGQTRRSDGLAMNLILPKPSEQTNRTVRAVVAAHSRQASGALHLWEVPLDTTPTAARPLEPFQTEFLPSPLTSISFNPKFTTQLLTVSSLHAVRIYDFALPSLPPDPDSASPFPSQGSWLLSLYQPFARPSAMRKPVLDASWISHGRAIFALLADGMWGIWDVDGSSPLQSGASMANKLKPGVQGAALTVFSVSGYIEGTGSLRTAAPSQKETHPGEFAPMTPHTRRQATASLGSASVVDRWASVRGGVRVTALPSNGNTLQDESVVLWVGGLEHVCVIPGVSRFWDSQLRKGAGGGVNLFSGAQPTRMLKMQDLSTGLLGERCCGVGLITDLARVGENAVDDGGLPVDILLQGETRFVVVREGEDGPGKKIGDVVTSRRKRLFAKDSKSEAIIVHGKPDRSTSLSFNLSTTKPGTLRRRPSVEINDANGVEEDALLLPSRTRSGFDFANTLSAAADASVDLTGRDVEAEMLDIMEIDQALKSMEDNRGTRRKKVLFEED